jgi:hypothetical protein
MCALGGDLEWDSGILGMSRCVCSFMWFHNFIEGQVAAIVGANYCLLLLTKALVGSPQLQIAKEHVQDEVQNFRISSKV